MQTCHVKWTQFQKQVDSAYLQYDSMNATMGIFPEPNWKVNCFQREMKCMKEDFPNRFIISHPRNPDVGTVKGITVSGPIHFKRLRKIFSVSYNSLLFFRFRLSHFRRSSSAAFTGLCWKCLLRFGTLTWSSAPARSDAVLARTAASFRNLVRISTSRLGDLF